jgi:hypothetical protein
MLRRDTSIPPALAGAVFVPVPRDEKVPACRWRDVRLSAVEAQQHLDRGGNLALRVGRDSRGRWRSVRRVAGAHHRREASMSGTRMLLIAFKRVVKGALRGFATVELPSGLRITDCPVLISNGKSWATLPSKPVLGADGRQSVVDGKRQYAAILEWRDRDLSTRFSDAVVGLVRSAHPDAFDEAAQ